MTKYEPVTKQCDRKHIESLMLQRLPTTNIGNSAFAGFSSILADLAHAEACLQEREAGIERLKAKCCDDGCRFNQSMAELLERIRSPECFDQSEYYYLWRDAAQLLATYHGTKGGDDDGK